MSGRPKNQVFLYDIYGKFIKTFPSENEFRRAYYPNDLGNRPLFRWEELGFIYHINLSSEIIAFRNRPGKDKVVLIVAIHNSEYCRNMDKTEQPIQVLNLKKELIAEFGSLRLLSKFSENLGRIAWYALQTEATRDIKKPRSELFFKYKKVQTDGTEA